MARTFVDTSLWLALRDAKSPHHAAAAAWLANVRGRLVTTTDVVDEVVTWAQRRWGHAVAVDLGRRLMDPANVHLVHVDPTFFDAGWELFQRRQDKGYSMTDCTSFAIMRALDLTDAATLDRHFGQEGFRVVPAP